jgi:hypothetical protein
MSREVKIAVIMSSKISRDLLTINSAERRIRIEPTGELSPQQESGKEESVSSGDNPRLLIVLSPSACPVSDWRAPGS